jgi:hypothetical protein
VKQHRSLSPDDIRASRANKQEKDQSELKAAFMRKQNALERQLHREYAKPKAELNREIGATEERIGKKGIFRAVVRKLTGAEKRDQAKLASLALALKGIEDRTQERREALKSDYARDWEKMERTHHAERERDEALIERKRTEGARGRAGEIARKSFRVRAGTDTAGHTPTPSDRKRAAKALDKVARKPDSDDSGQKREVSEEALERAKRRAEGVKRSRNRPRNKGKDFERD